MPTLYNHTCQHFQLLGEALSSRYDPWKSRSSNIFNHGITKTNIFFFLVGNCLILFLVVRLLFFLGILFFLAIYWLPSHSLSFPFSLCSFITPAIVLLLPILIEVINEFQKFIILVKVACVVNKKLSFMD